MRMQRHLALNQCHTFYATLFSQVAQGKPLALARLHRGAALQVGECERALAIAAIGGAEQREQRRVLRDRHELTVAEGPASRRKVEWEDTNFGDELIRHGALSGLAREDAE